MKMNGEQIKFLAQIIKVLEELNINTNIGIYFGDQEQIFIKENIKSDFAIQYNFSCNELIKIKESMKCDDIIWTHGTKPGQIYWIFYKLVYEDRKS